MTQIGRHDDVYLSTPLEQKLAWFQNAPGLSAVEPARQFMSGAAALYTDSDEQVRATMRNLGADWTGDAATNAGATLRRAADWSQDAAASHGTGGETVEGYGQSFESLRGQVHWDDPWAWGWNDTASAVASVATLSPAPLLGNLTVDYFTTAQQNRTNDATAVAALRAHEEQTRTAVDAFPSITPPAQIPQQTPVGGHLGGASGVESLPALPPPGGEGVAGVAGPIVAAAGGIGAAAGAGPGGTGGGRPAPTGDATVGGAGAAPGGAGSATALPGASGARPGQAGAAQAPPGGPAGAGGTGTGPGRGGALPGGALDPDGRVGAVGPGRRAVPGGGAPRGSDPRLRGGLDAPGGVRDPALRLPTGVDDPAGRLGGGNNSGGWRDVVARPPSETGLISRGPAAGPEFAARLPSGAGAGGTAAEGAGMPFVGGMGAGAGAQATAHRNTYWIRSAEPFDVPLPPHSEGVLHGGDA